MSWGQGGFWDVQDRLRELSAQGDPLEKPAATVDLGLFRPELTMALGTRELRKGGRPAFDPVLTFRMLVLHGLSLAQTGCLVAEQIDIAVPHFGDKSHISIDRRHGVIRRERTTDAAAHDGARLREGLVDPNDTASDVWADTACRSAENERYLADIGRVSRIHRRKPLGRPMPRHHARANAARSVVPPDVV